ncbi:MAG: hypothetical protein HYX78_10750 [Armatimonadetes bacterium]|nr:hypothetical protein [Armatimonadota bacterium]
MTSRERITTTLNLGIPDRVGILDAPWPETITRWHQEGLPASVSPHEFFDFDVAHCLYLNTSFMLPVKTLADDGESIVYSDDWGAVKKCWRSKTGTPLVLDYPVKSEQDWLKHKPSLQADLNRFTCKLWGDYSLPGDRAEDAEEQFSIWEGTLARYHQARKSDKFMFLFTVGPFESAGNCFSTEDLCVGIVESPELFQDIFHTVTDLIIESFLLLKAAGVEVDGIFLADDLAYKNGMLISPGVCRQLLLPCYQRICSFFREQGLTVTFHSDGNLREVLPLLLEAEITAIQPLEVKAGNDVRDLKKIYGDRAVFVGNIDVGALAGSKKDMEQEIKSKIHAAKENGGYIYHSDHSVPPYVSFDNYKYAIELVREHGSY